MLLRNPIIVTFVKRHYQSFITWNGTRGFIQVKSLILVRYARNVLEHANNLNHNKTCNHLRRKKSQDPAIIDCGVSIKEEIKEEERDEESLFIQQETRNNFDSEIVKEEIKEEQIDDAYSPIDYNTESSVKQEIKEDVKELYEGQGV